MHKHKKSWMVKISTDNFLTIIFLLGTNFLTLLSVNYFREAKFYFKVLVTYT